MAHVVLVGALPESLSNFRGDLIRAIISAGHDVTAMASPASKNTIKYIESFGAVFRPFHVHRNSLSPYRDVRTLLALHTAFSLLKPDVVLAYTIKPVIWGGLALRVLADVRFFALITGLGFAFQGHGWVRDILKLVVAWMYRASLSRASGVIFQNSDNREFFISHNLASAPKCHVVGGSGVDVSHFVFSTFPATPQVFLLISRLLMEKGLYEYVLAARIVKQAYPEAICQLLGPEDPSPDQIPIEEVKAWDKAGDIQYLGESPDVRPFIANCHIYVLPSYHEGMPRTVLEAMAMGRPILTTDVPGCRETVVPGENGFLVPKADAAALAERMIWFIENRDQWHRMGLASRRMAEERFDVHKVNAQMLNIMGLTAECSVG